jgi:DNA-directed RNA polymerase subunit M/transcription elongation factor TFIIS
MANDNPMRPYVRGMFDALLNHPSPINLEKSIYHYTVERIKSRGDVPSWENRVFREIYKQKYCNIIHHLKNIDCPLREMITNKEIKSYNVPSMSAMEMWPGGPYQVLYETRRREEDHRLAIQAALDKESSYEGMFKCGKCLGTRTSYYEMQTRRADEPMTCFITCINPTCGNRWKC